MGVDIDYLVKEFGEPLIRFLIDSFEDIEVVEDLLREDFVGFFNNRSDAGRVLMRRDLADVFERLENLCIDEHIDFAAYYKARRDNGIVHEVGTDGGFWVFIAH